MTDPYNSDEGSNDKVRVTESRLIEKLCSETADVAGAGILVLPTMIWIIQGIVWLKEGVWPGWGVGGAYNAFIGEALPTINTSFIGFNKVANWFLFDVSLAIIVGGLSAIVAIICFIGYVSVEQPDSRFE